MTEFTVIVDGLEIVLTGGPGVEPKVAEPRPNLHRSQWPKVGEAARAHYENAGWAIPEPTREQLIAWYGRRPRSKFMDLVSRLFGL